MKAYYYTKFTEDGMSQPEKYSLLKTGIRDLISRGRVVLSCEFSSVRDVFHHRYESAWFFYSRYMGRRAISRTGVRHNARKVNG